MKNFVTNTLPAPLAERLRQMKRSVGRPKGSERPQNTTAYPPLAEPGPLVVEVFEQIKSMPGWFTIDDCAHFYLILSLQTAYGLQGDLFEIGSYYGRSTAMMAYCLQPSEKIVVCDAFEQEIEDQYNEQPTPQLLIDNIMRVNPNLDLANVEIHACLSKDLALAEEHRFRFVHIDGGHSREAALGDMELCRQYLLPGGIMVVDDYKNADWPGVSLAVDEFLASYSQFTILADLNRHGVIGRKIYLLNSSTASS